MREPNRLTEYECHNCGARFTLKRKTNAPSPKCSQCKVKEANERAKNAQYYKREQYKIKAREWRLNRYYQLTREQFETLKEQQGNVCAICKQETELVVDHNHDTGEVRGLLCQNCNRAIGGLGDSLTNLRNSVAYLMNAYSWDEYFLEFARLAATRSKDPSSKVGAALVRDRIILSTGYNGLPRGIDDNFLDRYSRPLKYELVVHAEENAILNAARIGVSTEGATLYVSPFPPCSSCSKGIIQAGIERVVINNQQDNPRFQEEFEKGFSMLTEANIGVEEIQCT